MDEHLRNCPQLEEICAECGLAILRSEKSKHNCFEDMLKFYQDLSYDLDLIKSDHGLDYDAVNPKCN
jgi:hypothetical protein